MEKLNTALCQWTVLYIPYFNLYSTIYIQFSYLHALYRSINITTKLSLKVKSYFQS